MADLDQVKQAARHVRIRDVFGVLLVIAISFAFLAF